MELLLLAGAVAGAAWLTTKAIQSASRASVARRAQAAVQDSVSRRLVQQRAQRREQLRQQNAKARSLQVALLQVSRAPDFRRAASFAARARAVPAAFRQRQYRRFRPLLLRHFMARLQAGADADALLQSLRELLSHLSIPSYEADYIHTEAQAAFARPPVATPAPTYAQRMSDLQRDHEQRVQALRALQAVEGDTREQLLEAEETRFRQALQELGSEQTGTPRPTSI